MIPRPRKVRRLRRTRRLAMWAPTRMTMLAPVCHPSIMEDPAWRARGAAYVAAKDAAKAAEREAFEARKQARRRPCPAP